MAQKIAALSADWFHRLLSHRLIRFGMVGSSGVIVNQAVLYVSQEYLFTAIAAPNLRLDASLALAIFLATINNFYWNRLWTWGDVAERFSTKPIYLLFLEYALACWLGTTIQVVITKLLAPHFHYLLANLIAIVIATASNYVTNHVWTFGGYRFQLSRVAKRNEDTRVS